MLIYLNGQLLPEEEALISCQDRGFLYGDGLFETILVRHGKPFRWLQHLERMRQGLNFLNLHPAQNDQALLDGADQLIRANEMPDAVLRVTVSRGVGRRGYSPNQAGQPTVVLTLHPCPALDPVQPVQWRLKTSTVTLPSNHLPARFKTANKLVQVLARMEAEAKGMDEALLLNDRGDVVEGASGNLFWVRPDLVVTSRLDAGALPGITRSIIFDLGRTLHLSVAERECDLASFFDVEGAFLTMTSLGVVEVVELDGRPLRRSPLVPQLHQALQAKIETECGLRVEARSL